MNTTFKATKAQVAPLVKAAFPEYKGRKFTIEFAGVVTLHDLNWGDGTKNEYVALAVNGQMKPLRTSCSQFDPMENLRVSIPANVVIIQHSWFCGQDAGIRIWANPCYMPKWLTGGGNV